MGYLVLARKYRPKRFSQVVGQEPVVKTLLNALKQGKLTHALLFAGIKGTGKTTVARIVAKALNCQNLNPEEYEPCNACQSCLEITKGVHVDVLEIDAASNRGIDQIREIIDALRYAPARGRAKVYIIDEAHMLTKEASNALLKSLEEPPSHVYFILATTEPNKLPPTILSRCQRYEFRRLDLRLTLKHLQRICELEDYKLEPSALELIAQASQGSLRDALSLLDQAMAYGVRTKEDLIQTFGWHEEIIFEDLARALLDRDLKKTIQTVQLLYEKGVDLLAFMERLTQLFRELFIAKVISHDLSSLRSFEFRLLKDLFLLATKEDLILIYQTLYKGLEAIRRATYPQFQFELTLTKICEYEKFISLESLLEKLAEGKGSSALGVITPTFREEKDLKDKRPTLEDVLQEGENTTKGTQENEHSRTFSKRWKDFLGQVEVESLSLKLILTQLPEPREEGRDLVFILDDECPLLTSAYLDKFKDLVEKFFKKGVRFEIKVRKQGREEVKQRPEVQEIMRIFSAKIAHIQPIEEMK